MMSIQICYLEGGCGLFLSLLLYIFGCAAQDLSKEAQTHTILLSSLDTIYADNGVSEGFDLDNQITTPHDASGCYQTDLIDSSGREGIDNSYGTLQPFLGTSEIQDNGNALLDGSTQQIIPILIRISGVNDQNNDEQVKVEAILGEGPLLFGTDGEFLDGQTVAPDPEQPIVTAQHAYIEQGVLHIEGFPFFNALLPGTFGSTGAMRAQFNRGNIVQGLAGASMPVEGMYALYDDVSYTDFLNDHINRAADMNPDENGFCQEISSVYSFVSTSAHLLGEVVD